jgi:Tol biopolymer transport system component
MVVSLNGVKKVLTDFWESERGLAWTPGGDELWFAAAKSGVSRAIYGVNLSGHTRTVLNVAGGLTLEDISRDGRLLLSRDNERLGILFMGAGEKEPRELSWKDWSIAMDISSDGKQILFGAEGEDSGFSYQVGLRPTDGSPPVMLGAGAAQSLSPDGKWALSIMPPPTDRMVLLPTGAGTSKTLERGAIEHYQLAGARWFPDAKRIMFVASEADHGQRCYVQSIEAGKPRAFTADGVGFCSVSPKGEILAVSEDHRVLLYASESNTKPYKEFEIAPGELPSGWSSDGTFLYISQTRERPMTISRIELASGHRQLWKQLPPPPDNSAMKSEEVVISPDGQNFAYTYSHHLSDLYLVQGLK